VVYRCTSKIDGVQVASPAILRGRNMIIKFTQGDHVVVTVFAGRLRTIKAQIMVKRAGRKRARCVAVPAIPVGRVLYRVSDSGLHMRINQQVVGRRSEFVGWFTARRVPMTGIASVADNGRDAMVGHGKGKTCCTMTKSTILSCCRVCRYR
jgi:hypothetical protein